MTRIAWADLPATVHRAVETHTGPITAARDVPHGLTCAAAAVLETATGTLFVKGVREDDAEGRAAQDWEMLISRGATLADVAPHLRRRIVTAGWDLLEFRHIDGRHADLSPGSPHLPLVADLLRRAETPAAPTGVPSYADQWGKWLDGADRTVLDGHHLLHTDTNPHNLLVTPERAWLVDWAMPASGPAWVDVAYTAVRLIEAGHTGAQARTWAEQIPAWRGVTPSALHAWVTAHCRHAVTCLGTVGAQWTTTQYRALLPG